MTTLWKKSLRIIQVRRWLTAAAVAAGLCTLLLAAGCTARSSAPSSPMTGSFKLEGRPALGQPFTLQLELRTSMAFTDVEVAFFAPAGVELLSTPEPAYVDMEVGAAYPFSATARIVEDGYFRVCGGGVKNFSSSSYFGYGDCVYILVEGEDTWFSHDPPPNHWESAHSSASGGLPLQPELIQTRLYLSGTLALNQPVDVVFEVIPQVDLHNGTIGIVTPIGGMRNWNPRIETNDTALASSFTFSTRDGAYYWNGPLKQNQRYSFVVTLEPTAGGEGLVRAGIDETGSVDSVSRPVIATSQALTLTLYSPSLAR